MYRLIDVAEIRMGATLRGRDATRSNQSGSCHFVRIGDISQDGGLLTDKLTRIEPNDPVNEDLFLRAGDVLFPNRGTRTTALAYNLDLPHTIAGAQFFILRPNAALVLPEYLAWTLRSEKAARYFDERRKGTYIKIIQRSDLAEMQIPVPPLNVQQKIAETAGLAVRERILTERLASLKWKHTKSLLSRAANDHSETNPKEPSK